MSKVLWHTLMSLDGFIAGPGGDTRWAFRADAGPNDVVNKVVATTGALLVGRRTQDVEDRDQHGFYGGAYRGPFFVLRHSPPAQPPVVKGVTGQFLDTSVQDAVAIAKQAAAPRSVVLLGANVARQCLEAGLLDEVLVHVAPVLLGDGTRLFDRPAGRPVQLHKTRVQEDGQLTALRFAVA